MLIHIKEIIKYAKKRGVAVPAFNIYNREMIVAVVCAAKVANVPVVIQVSENLLTQTASAKSYLEMVESVLRDEKAEKVKVAMHLDHGKTFKIFKECIDAGFTSAMIDASGLGYKENIALTKKAANYAHKKGAWAQGELGALAVNSEIMTDPALAKEFVKKTGIDAFAPAIGNIHGVQKLKNNAVPKLDMGRLKEIAKSVKIPFVLHGASGIPAREVQETVKLGVCIVNIASELRMAYVDSLQKALKENPNEYYIPKLFLPVVNAVQEVAAQKIQEFTRHE